MYTPRLRELITDETITKELVDLQIQCAVCLNEFYLNESGVRKLTCDHLFHAKCLFPWLRRNASCPVCRRKLLNAYLNRVSHAEILETQLSDMRARLESFRRRFELHIQQRRASQIFRSRNQTTTITSSTANSIANENAQTSTTPPHTRSNGSENTVRALPGSPNVNSQRTRTPPQTVVSPAQTNGCEHPVCAFRQSTRATEEVTVPRRRTALRARTGIAGIYRRPQSYGN